MHQKFSLFCVTCCDVSSFVTNDAKLIRKYKLFVLVFSSEAVLLFLPTHRDKNVWNVLKRSVFWSQPWSKYAQMLKDIYINPHAQRETVKTNTEQVSALRILLFLLVIDSQGSESQ